MYFAFYNSAFSYDVCITVNLDLSRPPEVTKITASPLRVQPGERIEIHVASTADNPRVFISWNHDNITYKEHIRENPSCKSKVSLCVYVCVTGVCVCVCMCVMCVCVCVRAGLPEMVGLLGLLSNHFLEV